MTSLPAASLILCSRNRPRLLWEAVQSVLAGGTVPAEILIVDQSDRPHPTLPCYTPPRPCVLRYRWSASRGLSRARTMAIRKAAHDIVVFLDDDMLVPAEWFATLVRALVAAGPHAVVTGQVRPAVAEVRGGFQLSLKVDPEPMVYRGRVGRDELAGGHMATYRSVITAVGGFDPRLGPGAAFPAAEDNDLGFRLLEAGYCIHYVPEAVVYHRAWRTGRAYLPLRWSYGVGQGAFYAKHIHRGDPYMLRRLAQDFHYLLRRPARLVRERRWAGGYAVFLLGELVGASRWLLPPRRRAAR